VLPCILTLALCVSAGCAADPPRLNGIINALEQGRAAMGTVNRQAPRSSDAARALALRNLDFAVFDVESGMTNLDQFSTSLRVLRDPEVVDDGHRPVSPIVRIPASLNDSPEDIVRTFIDLGVFGVMFGHIDTPERAERAVAAVRRRQRGPDDGPRAGAAAAYWGLATRDYATQADVWPLDERGELVAIMMIESPEAIEHVNEIAQVPGVAALFFGPGDYGRAIGKRSRLPEVAPETEAAVQTMLRACQAHGVACGYPVAGPPAALPDEA
jgi:4-hydroxy-2-oxoheptanedioate aldolase